MFSDAMPTDGSPTSEIGAPTTPTPAPEDSVAAAQAPPPTGITAGEPAFEMPEVDFSVLENEITGSEDATRKVAVGPDLWTAASDDEPDDPPPFFDAFPYEAFTQESFVLQEAPIEAAAPSVSSAEQLGSLSELQRLVDRLTSHSTANHKAFLMIQRLLNQGRPVPSAMLQSIQPYLYDLMNDLLPRLNEPRVLARFGDFAERLIRDCQLLCQPTFSPAEMKSLAAPATLRISELLAELSMRISQAIDELSGY